MNLIADDIKKCLCRRNSRSVLKASLHWPTATASNVIFIKSRRCSQWKMTTMLSHDDVIRGVIRIYAAPIPADDNDNRVAFLH